MNRDDKLKEQQARWPRAVQAGREGNPYATLCLHCYGRHAPPRDDLCPHDPPKATAITSTRLKDVSE